MAAQLNNSAEDIESVAITVNTEYTDEDASREIVLIVKEGCTMPTTGGGLPWQP